MYEVALRSLCALRVQHDDLRDALGRVCRLAVDGLPGVEAASAVLGPPGQPVLLATSSTPAQTADGLQHLAGCGPMFDAYDGDIEVRTDGLFTDERWPGLARVPATERIVSRAFSVPLRVEHNTLGAMTFYEGDHGGRALPFTARAQALVQEIYETRQLTHERDQLREALISRAVIDQAKGMIMMTRHCDAAAAFRVLSQVSSASGRKVRDVAADVVNRLGVLD